MSPPRPDHSTSAVQIAGTTLSSTPFIGLRFFVCGTASALREALTVLPGADIVKRRDTPAALEAFIF
jgi:hypothetical protein